MGKAWLSGEKEGHPLAEVRARSREQASARGYQSDGPKSQDVGRAGHGPSTLPTGFHF